MVKVRAPWWVLAQAYPRAWRLLRERTLALLKQRFVGCFELALLLALFLEKKRKPAL